VRVSFHVADDDDDDDEQHEHDCHHAHASVLKRLCICAADGGEVYNSAVVLCARLREGRDLTLVAAGMGMHLFIRQLN
jgi:hypothetical protein